MGLPHLVLAATMTAGPLPLAAPPAGACTDPGTAHPVITAEPWAQRTLSPASVWPFSTGRGVTVAVVDSGVDSDHPQLRRRRVVLRGEDFDLVGDLPGNFDCDSHGTAVASIIAAQPVAGVGFAGLAPGAAILPVRVNDRGYSEGGGVETIDPRVLARGIWYAVDHGADVLNLSLAGAADDPLIRDAVAYAVQKDVLVVAAAGNDQDGTAQRRAYPAAYDGVLGVGAVGPGGQRLPASQIGPHVDLVAPGGEVTAATRTAGHQSWQGTSFAAPFVAATAALVRSAWPELTARQVADRLIATATPAPGGGAAYGAGLVNPYRAVTDGLVGSTPAAVPPLRPDPPQLDRPSLPALRILGLAVLTALLLAAFTALARHRRWQPRRAVPAPDRPATTDVPERLF